MAVPRPSVDRLSLVAQIQEGPREHFWHVSPKGLPHGAVRDGHVGPLVSTEPSCPILAGLRGRWAPVTLPEALEFARKHGSERVDSVWVWDGRECERVPL